MVTIEDAEFVASHMVTNSTVQVAQTLFRMQLVESWQIPQGAKVLEIGCGQGDMTAVLAHVVGGEGHITAVDSASPDYGAPVTLGRSAEHLKNTSLGERITFHFECDLMKLSPPFDANMFDYVVLAHCSWYFGSLDQLRQLLIQVRPWARRLCFSEWDIVPHSLDQVAHMLAVLIQGQVEAYKADSTNNVHTPFSRTRFKELLQETGWSLSSESLLDSTPLQDADWEIDICLNSSLQEALPLDLPLKHLELLKSQLDTLRQIDMRGKNRSLSSYAIVAEKEADHGSR